MGRSGLYKSDVEKARRALLTQGKNPSVDLVRVQLGNTGSRTTIHRFLKELEVEETAPVGAKLAVSDALQAHVAKLSEQLHDEAEARIAEHRAQFEAQLRAQSEVAIEARKEAAELRAALQRAEAAGSSEQAAHQDTQRQLQQAQVQLAQQEERLAAQHRRAADQEAHLASLEEKHQQVRQTLEHFRTAIQEQRGREQRQHEQAMQALQAELRAALDQVAAKNAELLPLHRDNGRFLEQARHQQAAMAAAERELTQARQELDGLRRLPAQLEALERRAAQAVVVAETLENQLADARSQLERAHQELRTAELDRTRVEAKLEGMQAALALREETKPAEDATAAGAKKKGRPALTADSATQDLPLK